MYVTLDDNDVAVEAKTGVVFEVLVVADKDSCHGISFTVVVIGDDEQEVVLEVVMTDPPGLTLSPPPPQLIVPSVGAPSVVPCGTPPSLVVEAVAKTKLSLS